MILVGTLLQVIDNSGAKKVKCLKILGGSNARYGIVGSTIIVSVKTVNPLKKIKKGEVYKAVIVSIKKKRMRFNGSFISFGINSVVIVNNKFLPIATRILFPVMAELRDFTFSKIVSMATVTV